MAGPLAKAYVEIHGDMSKFQGDVQRGMQTAFRAAADTAKNYLDSIAAEASLTANKTIESFDRAGRGIGSTFQGLTAGNLMGGIVEDADSVARQLVASFSDAAGQARDALGTIGYSDLGDPEQVADHAAASVASSFGDASEQSETALALIGRTDFGGVGEKAQLEAAQVSRAFEGAGQSSEHAFAQHIGGIKTLIVGLAAAALAKPMMIGVTSAASLEQTRIGFQALYGSVDEADRRIKEFQQFAATTPFEFPDLISAAQKLKAVGVEADDVIPRLTAIGDVAATLGAGAQSINGVVYAMQQMSGAGRIMTQDLYQVQNALPGFSVFKVLAEHFGVTTGEMRDMVSEGLVPADEGIKALIDGMKEFPGAAGAMERQSTTLNGLFSTFKDVSRQALVDGFGPLVTVLKDGLGQATPVVERLIKAIAPPLAEMGSIIIPALLDAIDSLSPVMHVVFGTLADLLAAAAPVAARLLAALLPIVETIANLAGSILPPFITIISDLVDVFGPVIQVAGDFISLLANRLGPILEQTIVPVIDDFTAAMGPILVEAVQAVGATLLTLFDALSPLFPIISDVAGILLGAFSTALKAIVDAVAPILPKLGELIGKLVQGLAPILPPLAAALGKIVEALAKALGPQVVAITGSFIKLIEAILPLLPPLIDIANVILPAVADILAFLIPLWVQWQTFLDTFMLGALTKLVEALGWAIDKMETMFGWLVDINSALGGFGSILGGGTVIVSEHTKALIEANSELGKLADRQAQNGAMQEYVKARTAAYKDSLVVLAEKTGSVTSALQLEQIELQSTATDTDTARTAADLLTDQIKHLYDTLGEKQAWADFQEKMYEYHSKGIGVSKKETLEFAEAIADMTTKLVNVPPVVQSDIIAKLQSGDIEAAEAALLRFTEAGRWKVEIGAFVNPKLGVTGRYASGVQSAAPGPAWVGERGPELVWMHGGERVMPAGESRRYAEDIVGPTPLGTGGAALVHVEQATFVHPTDLQSLASVVQLAVDLRTNR